MVAAKKKAGRVLATTVHVNGVVYDAGSEVPADVADLITNPKAWADDAAPESEAEASADSEE